MWFPSNFKLGITMGIIIGAKMNQEQTIFTDIVAKYDKEVDTMWVRGIPLAKGANNAVEFTPEDSYEMLFVYKDDVLVSYTFYRASQYEDEAKIFTEVRKYAKYLGTTWKPGDKDK